MKVILATLTLLGFAAIMHAGQGNGTLAASFATPPPAASGEKTTGKGRVIWGHTPAEVLTTLGTPKDFEAVSTDKENKILFAHRRDDSDDIYFIANHREELAKFTGVFRVQGKIPQAWNPKTGEITALSEVSAKGERVEVPLQLEANASLFVVFRDKHTAGHAK